jgi:hypothetical protein
MKMGKAMGKGKGENPLVVVLVVKAAITLMVMKTLIMTGQKRMGSTFREG